ncbi:hypothetical protein ACIA58_14615 [Kribbella sp. NPDC051586]|uniref:hypothetical protein n=1 Tax=Kribbella sp. NPDC051586 TaxID=3364118 RepID=UPI0037A626A0
MDIESLSERLEKISVGYGTFHQEFADVLCQLLLFAKQHDVDLPAEIESKWLVYEV